jgi:hypothetical protein
VVVRDYEIVRAHVEVNVNASRGAKMVDGQVAVVDEDRTYTQSVSKIGDTWVETNGYVRFDLNPETGRLEKNILKYGVVEYLQESIDRIRELHVEAKTFHVGEGVHFSYGSDTYPGTVIEVRGSVILVQEDEEIPYHKDIFTESQDWDFVRNPRGAIKEFRRKRDGYYAPKGCKSPTLFKGRHKHYDPHF